jgi:hypothetical protein
MGVFTGMIAGFTAKTSGNKINSIDAAYLKAHRTA